MKKKMFIVLALVLVGATVVALASCLGKDTDTPAAVVEDLAYITANKKLVIGITDFEPMDYQDASGKWIGFDAELAEKVCEKLGVTADFKLIEWKQNVTELNGKTIDCIWNGYTIDEDRQKKVSFSEEYMLNKQVIVIRKADASKYTDIASLKDASLVAEENSAGENSIKADATLKDNNYVALSGQTDALKEIIAKTSDAAVIDYTMAKYLLSKESGDFKDLAILDVKFSDDEFYGIGFRKGSDLTAKVNEILAGLEADGTIKEIAEKYGLADSLVKIK